MAESAESIKVESIPASDFKELKKESKYEKVENAHQAPQNTAALAEASATTSTVGESMEVEAKAEEKAEEELIPAADSKELKVEPKYEITEKAQESAPEPAPQIEVKSTPKAEGKEEIPVLEKIYIHVCRICNNIFKEKIPIACEHLMFCRRCLEECDLSDSMIQVCTRCSAIPVRRNQQWDSQQDILSLMHLRAKYKRGICDKPAVNMLCHVLNLFLNTGTKPCSKGCETCTMITLTDEDSAALTGPNGNIVIGPSLNIVIGPNGNTVVVGGKFTCKSKNVIYFIYCRRQECRKAYVGQTTQTLQLRMTEHRNKIKNLPTTNLVTKHFNLPKHNVNDCKVCVIKEFPADTNNLTKVMGDYESKMIKQLGTKEPNGLNTYKG